VGVSVKAIQDEKMMAIELSIYCKLWEEDGVWNSCAIDLPIAAFGKSIEDAKANLEEAIHSHFCALEALGKVNSAVVHLLQAHENRELNSQRLMELSENVLMSRFVMTQDAMPCAELVH
jgi:predicted RNase H-like HicB family nuclease